MIFKRAVAKLRAQNWVAITIELVIVTVGVLIALAAQQWAENRNWSNTVATDKVALRDELGEHYGYAVEFRVVYPCLQAQLYGLRDRVLSSGSKLNPAPVYSEAGDEFLFRKPIKFYPTDAWEESINDGVVQRFDPAIRRQFAGHYASLERLRTLESSNMEDEQALMALAQPMPLDPQVRYGIVERIEQLRARLQWLDTMNGQVIDYIAHIGMVPPAAEAQAVAQRYGTYRFCKAHGLPVRPFKEAMQAVPN
jgi:hypothetical protein